MGTYQGSVWDGEKWNEMGRGKTLYWDGNAWKPASQCNALIDGQWEDILSGVPPVGWKAPVALDHYMSYYYERDDVASGGFNPVRFLRQNGWDSEAVRLSGRQCKLTLRRGSNANDIYNVDIAAFRPLPNREAGSGLLFRSLEVAYGIPAYSEFSITVSAEGFAENTEEERWGWQNNVLTFPWIGAWNGAGGQGREFPLDGVVFEML